MTKPKKPGQGELASSVWFTFTQDRKRARHRYFETFGRSVTDPAIDEEFDRLVEDALSKEEDAVRIPAPLALAMFIRPHGHGKARPPKERVPRRAEAIAVSRAERRWQS